MKPTKKQKIILLIILAALVACIIGYVIFNNNAKLIKGELPTEQCSIYDCKGHLYVSLGDSTPQQLRYNQDPSTILNIKLNANGDPVLIRSLHFKFMQERPDIKNIKFLKKIPGYEPTDVQGLIFQENGNEINVRIDSGIYITKDSYINLLLTAQSNETADPSKKYHIVFDWVSGIFKTTEPTDDCPDDESCFKEIPKSEMGFIDDGDVLNGADFQIMPGSLKIESTQQTTPTLIEQNNRTGLLLGEINVSSIDGTTKLNGIKINLTFRDENNPGNAQIIKNFQVRGRGRLQNSFVNTNGTENPEPPGLVQLNAITNISGKTISMRFNPPLTIKNNSTENIQFVCDIDETAKPTEFTPQITSKEDIIGSNRDNMDDEDYVEFFKDVQIDIPLNIGKKVKIPVSLNVTAVNSGQQLPFYIENQIPVEIARFKLRANKALKIGKISVSTKDDVGTNKLPFSKIKETATFILNDRNSEDEICISSPDYIRKKITINCDGDSTLSFTENMLEKTIIVKSKLDSGLNLGQKFALILKAAEDITTDVPIITTGLPAAGPTFTITNVADIEVSATGEPVAVVATGEPKFARLITVKFDIKGGDPNIVKKIKKITFSRTNTSDFANEKIDDFRLIKKDGTDLSTNALATDIIQDTNGTVAIEFLTGEGENYTVLSSGFEFTLAANLNPRSSDKDKRLQYKISNVEIDPAGVNKIIVQADGPKISFGDRACPNGKTENNEGTCECPQSPIRTYEYIDQPTFYSRANGNICIPCKPEKLETSDGVLICPQDRVSRPGTLTITAKLPDGQSTNIPYDETTIKAIEIDLSKQGGDLLGDQLKRFDLVFEGDFNTNLIYDPELFSVSGAQKTQLTDEQVDLKYSSTNGIINAEFTTPPVIGESKKLVLYLKTNATDVDAGKKFRYKVSGVETDPSAPITKVYSNGDNSVGPQFIVPNKPTLTVINNIINNNNGTGTPADFPLLINDEDAVYGTNVLGAGIYYLEQTKNPQYTVSAWGGACSADGKVTLAAGEQKTCTITNDDIALPYCESKGKFTYTGKDIPGLLYGNCIDCTNEDFNPEKGICGVKKVVADDEDGGNESAPKAQEPNETISETNQQRPASDSQIPNTPVTDTLPNNPADNPKTEPDPNLRGSARLVTIPDRGNTGPEIALYFGAIAVTYAVMRLRKKRNK